jgi:wyosine [tRNA(Phe)-imidazoG37] synthetase (radical SAM superfamily)
LTKTKYTYGPVPSRRLGRSLGVSIIPPKTCSYSCVYCQLGRTDHLQTKRESFFDPEEILRGIASNSASQIDYVTFAGDGEPTLSLDLGWLIRRSKEAMRCPVAVITNGSLLWQKEVRKELIEADVVLPSLDAGNESLFRTINRPYGALKFNEIIKGMVDFRHEYKGQIWLEVMLLQDINDNTSALDNFDWFISQINPDRIYITTPIRPPAEPWVKVPTPEAIIRAQEVIGNSTAIREIENGEFGLGASDNAEEAILEICSRHPLRIEQAIDIEKGFPESGILDKMMLDGRLLEVTYNSSVYLLPAKFVRGK